MAVQVNVTQANLGNPDRTQAMQVVRGTLTLSGNYSSGGDTVSFAGVSDLIKSDQPPAEVYVYETTPAADGPGSLYTFTFLPGTTPANGVLVVSLGGVQLAAGPYPDPPLVNGFQLSFTAYFPMFL